MLDLVKPTAWLFALLVLVAPLHAAALLTTPGTPTTVNNPQGGRPALDRVFGYSFTVGTQALDITALGMWDYERNGLPAQLHVALWDNLSNTMLASVAVPQGMGGRLEGEFRYVDLPASVRIEAGKTYTLGYRRTLVSYAGMVQTMTTYPTFSPEATRAAGLLRTPSLYYLPGSFDASPLAYPTAPLADQRPTQYLGGSDVIVGPNLLYTVVPEPASLSALAGGALILLPRRRRIVH